MEAAPRHLGGTVRRAVAVLLLSSLASLAAAGPASAAFPGTNNRIAFEGPGLSGVSNSSIFTMAGNGTGKVNLTSTPVTRGASVGSRDPSYSSDGNRIVFARVVQGSFSHDIWVMNADGSGQTNLTNVPTGRETQPSFSPDGSKIVYISEPDGADRSIAIMNANGSGQTNLALPGIDFFNGPEFSPDGTRIVFEGTVGMGDSDIYTVNVGGSGLTNVTSAVNGVSREPSWSPDGTRIAFTNLDTEPNIYVIGASGGAFTDLTSSVAGGNPGSPAFSPDGTRIAYDRTDGMDQDIFTMGSTDGLGQTNLTSELTSEDLDPNWGPTDADPPETTVDGGPRKKSKSRKAKLRFSTDEAGATFQCALEGKGVKPKLGKFRACESPLTYRGLASGPKRFEVRAVDAAGNVDGTPAKRSWKIKRARKKPK